MTETSPTPAGGLCVTDDDLDAASTLMREVRSYAVKIYPTHFAAKAFAKHRLATLEAHTSETADLRARLAAAEAKARDLALTALAADGQAIEAYDKQLAAEARERVNCEELAIMHGQQVTVTFKDPADAFALFNEIKARAALQEPK